jgi:hypothetical protein
MTHSSCTCSVQSQFINDKGRVFLIQTKCKQCPQYLIPKIQTDPDLTVEMIYELTRNDLKQIKKSNRKFTLDTNIIVFNNVPYIAPYVILNLKTTDPPDVDKLDEHTDFSLYLQDIDTYIPITSLNFNNNESHFKEYEDDFLFIKIIFQFMYVYLITHSNEIQVDAQKSIKIYNNVLYKFHEDGVVTYEDLLINKLFYVSDDSIKHKLTILNYPIVKKIRVSRDHIMTSDLNAVNKLYMTNDFIIRPYITPKGGFFTFKDNIYSVSNINTLHPIATHHNLDHFIKNETQSDYIELFNEVYSIVKLPLSTTLTL